MESYLKIEGIILSEGPFTDTEGIEVFKKLKEILNSRTCKTLEEVKFKNDRLTFIEDQINRLNIRNINGR